MGVYELSVNMYSKLDKEKATAKWERGSLEIKLWLVRREVARESRSILAQSPEF